MNEAIVIVVVALAAVVALFVAAHRQTTFFVAEVRAGELRVVRGKIAPRVLADLREIVKRPPLQKATLSIVRADKLARLEINGTVAADQAQRLRNAIGILPLAKLRNAR